MTLHSAIYEGSVAHLRNAPRRHAFRYRLYMLYLDLDELESFDFGPLLGVHRAGVLSYKRRDYRGTPESDLKQVILDEVESSLGYRPDGPVRLLTQVRSFGYVFNPVSFYYCFGAGGETLQAVLAEITNTPWNERHAYVIPAGGHKASSEFEKKFHVSPFWSMKQRYQWQLSEPDDALRVEMRNVQDGEEVFRVLLKMRRKPLSRRNLVKVAVFHPLMSGRAHLAIYWQALRLWLKRTPVFDHPKTMLAEASVVSRKEKAR